MIPELHEIGLQRISDTEKGIPLSPPSKVPKTPSSPLLHVKNTILADRPDLQKQLKEVHEDIIRKIK